MEQLPGITLEAEQEKLRRTLLVAEEKVLENKNSIRMLAEELHAMQEEFDESDKEAQALWHNTDARFKFVNQDLKRAEQARKKPYFGRIDFTDKKIGKEEAYYIGRSVIAKDPAHPEVIDWRAPIAGVYYDAQLGDVTYSVKGEGKFDITLTRKRTYEIENDKLKDFYDSDVVANDELLTKYLAKNKRAVLGEIIATIQKEQNDVIRKKPQHNLIIQGAAGSGKTTVAMHRISYILYNYELEFAPEDFYIIGSNSVLLNYITGVLPELNVYGVSQMTMEQLFIRLLYEEWDKKYTVKPVKRGLTNPIKGTEAWFFKLEEFCDRYEKSLLPIGDVRLEKNNVLLLSKDMVQRIIEENKQLSRADKISRLTEYLMAKLENEISGKYYSYTENEKKKLLKQYEVYFGKREWKGSVVELYNLFLEEQRKQGVDIPMPEEAFDVYDLAALAYLYKRIKEDEIIREAGHVVIDEAQDFGMMAYHALKYCLSKCTYTIMGDVSQNIFSEYGLNDWSKLRKLMLPGEFDYFGLLRKSYRNTVEISHFATDILYHGSFQIYPVEPIIRHGDEVVLLKKENFADCLTEVEGQIQKWQAAGMETIAVICADEEERKAVEKGLRGKVDKLKNSEDSMEFSEGVMVLSLEYTKGLEFDAVLIFDASAEKYPEEDGFVKRLYVAATRALHELTVLYTGQLTELISKAVDEEKKKKAVVKVSKQVMRQAPEAEDITNEELELRQAREGEKERARRSIYGPKAIEAKKVSDTERNRNTKGYMEHSDSKYAVPTYLERTMERLKKETTKEDVGEFGEMPADRDLQPAGHTKIDCATKFVMKGKGYYDVLSQYGTLRIMPLSSKVVRICFAKGQRDKFPAPLSQYSGMAISYKARETKDALEILTEKVLIKVEKKNGALQFLTPKGKIILSERMKEPRQVAEDRAWVYFNWGKDENLIAKGVTPEKMLKIGTGAKYISFGERKDVLPGLFSPKGYEIMFPDQIKTLCCNIPMYGSYVSFEGTQLIDFYVIINV